MKFLFLLLLFLNIFCENFIINDVYLHLHFIKIFKILENKSQVFERGVAQLHNDLYYNELVIAAHKGGRNC